MTMTTGSMLLRVTRQQWRTLFEGKIPSGRCLSACFSTSRYESKSHCGYASCQSHACACNVRRLNASAMAPAPICGSAFASVQPFRCMSTTKNDKEEEQVVSPEDLKLAIEATQQARKDDELLTDLPGSKSGGKKLAILFTCTVCNTRSAKQFTEHAYQNGVVLVRCPGCQNLHLIADRLGMFEDKGEDGKGWDIEKAMSDMGEKVVAVTNDNVLELTLKDVLGEKLDDVTAAAASESQPDTTK